MDGWGVLAVLTFLASLGTVAGFLGRSWWVFDLASHFRPHYFAILSLCSLISTIAQRYDEALISGALALANAALILPLYLPPTRQPPGARGALRLWMLNVNYRSRAYARAVQAARDADADVILLIEVGRAWLEAFAPLREQYPHGGALSAEEGVGIALLSRVPLQAAEVRAIGRAKLPTVIARLTVNGCSLRLIGTHPLAPHGKRFTDLRNEQLQQLACLTSGPDGTPAAILMGDLNTTSWSPAFRDLVAQSGLRDSREGLGVQATWPSPFGRGGIPIDHYLVSPHLRVVRRVVGPDVGSDHLPVTLDVAWR